MIGAGGVIGAGVGGLLLGSFATVVAHRVPQRESIVRPRSRCPSCGSELAARDNLPVLSWILLRGRCRRCRTPIPARYPSVEIATGGLFALAAARLDATDLVAYLPVLWVLVVLAAIDLEHKLLPNRVVVPSLIVAVPLFAASAALGPGMPAFARALVAAAASFGGFLLIAIISPAGMGMGDVKLAPLLGMSLGYLGWGRVFVGFFVAFALGALAGVVLMAVRRAGRKTQVPFGPALAAGTVIGILAGGPIVRVWLGS